MPLPAKLARLWHENAAYTHDAIKDSLNGNPGVARTWARLLQNQYDIAGALNDDQITSDWLEKHVNILMELLGTVKDRKKDVYQSALKKLTANGAGLVSYWNTHFNGVRNTALPSLIKRYIDLTLYEIDQYWKGVQNRRDDAALKQAINGYDQAVDTAYDIAAILTTLVTKGTSMPVGGAVF